VSDIPVAVIDPLPFQRRYKCWSRDLPDLSESERKSEVIDLAGVIFDDQGKLVGKFL
jgi:hypothetical protein